MREIILGGKTYEIYSFSGKVVGANKTLETKVTGSGGGGSIQNGSGYSAPVTITSHTITHNDLFVTDESGKEHALQLTNWDIPVREGHELKAVWLIKKGYQLGNYVVIKNITLNETRYDTKELEKLNRTSFIKSLIMAIAALIVFSIMDTIIGGKIIGFIGFLTAIGILINWWRLGSQGARKLILNGALLA